MFNQIHRLPQPENLKASQAEISVKEFINHTTHRMDLRLPKNLTHYKKDFCFMQRQILIVREKYNEEYEPKE